MKESETDFLYQSLPIDPENQILLANEHPSNWVNPCPKKIYDLIVIGAGPAGLVSAITARDQGKSVALIERDLIGGECMNIGCIPSKAILRTSRLYADMLNAENFGAEVPNDISINFDMLMARMRRIRTQISGHISVKELHKKGIDLFFGQARFDSSRSIRVDNCSLRFKKSIIATGSEPEIPAIPGLAEAGYLTDKTIFNLSSCPESLLVIGGGALGCELAQAFARFGTKVTIVQTNPFFLNNVERDGAQILSDALADDGIGIFLNSEVSKIQSDGSKKIIEIATADTRTTVTVTHILVGIGQVPNTRDLGLDAANVSVADTGHIIVDAFLRTSNSRIYGVGNICAEEQFAHIPDALARIAAENALFNKREKVDTSSVPWCIYTDPELAHIGLQVKEAREQKIPVKTFTILLHQVTRAIADSEDVGFVKIHVKEGTDQILGATLVSRHAGDIMNIISLAIKSKIGLAKLATINYPYPTQGNAIKMAAVAYLHTLRPSWLRNLRNRFFK
jgi:pyruvate/2-oxoglutarate dehydrogenase complex dihydrolipoamide dehydrogenase (E3) component